MVGLKIEGTDSGIYKIKQDGTITKFRNKAGPLLQKKKISIGVLESYLAVQIDDHAFEILGGLDQNIGFVVDKLVVIPVSKMESINSVKIFEAKKVAVCGSDGTLMIYEIVSNCKLKLVYERLFALEPNECVDCFDILVTGQVVVLITKFKNRPCVSKMLVFKLNPKPQEEKAFFSFDFTSQPQKYSSSEFYTTFHDVNINMICGESPVIIGIQGSNDGHSTNLFAAVVEKTRIKELVYEEEFTKGEFIDVAYHQGDIYVLDSNCTIKKISLPIKQ